MDNPTHEARFRISHGYNSCPAKTPFKRLYVRAARGEGAGFIPWAWMCPDCDGIAVDKKEAKE